MPKAKRINPVDVEVGGRIRLYRLNARLSQTALADAIGVSFQQVQKYEKGANRVGASRLTQIANALKVPVIIFFGDQDANSKLKSVSETSVTDLLTQPHALRLLRAYSKISDSRLRLSLVEVIERAGEQLDD